MTDSDEGTDGGEPDEEEEEGPPYSRLDRETAARCGLWLETE